MRSGVDKPARQLLPKRLFIVTPERHEGESVGNKLTPARKEELAIYLMVAVVWFLGVIAGYMVWIKVN